MAEHPNVARIREGYEAFGKGDLAALNDLFADDVVWHVTGRNQLAGDYRGKEAVFGFLARLMELTEGSLSNDLHAVLADDEHGVALLFTTGHRGEVTMDTPATHVFHFRDGRVTEFWGMAIDQYAFDELVG